MNASVVLSALDPRRHVVLEVEDREIDVAIAQKAPPGPRIVDPGDLLHPEHFDVKARRLVHVLRRKGYVLDLRHGVSPSANRRPFVVPLRARALPAQRISGGGFGRGAEPPSELASPTGSWGSSRSSDLATRVAWRARTRRCDRSPRARARSRRAAARSRPGASAAPA